MHHINSYTYMHIQYIGPGTCTYDLDTAKHKHTNMHISIYSEPIKGMASIQPEHTHTHTLPGGHSKTIP